MMQAIGRVYVRYFNTRHKRTGTLWEGRYRSTPIDSERYLFACSRYIELNPVRAGMVRQPNEYRWSSYRHNAHGKPDSLVTPHAAYRALETGGVPRQTAYQALFEHQLDANALDAIRRATNRGTALGDAQFCDEIEATLGRAVKPLAHGGDRRSSTRRSILERKS